MRALFLRRWVWRREVSTLCAHTRWAYDVRYRNSKLTYLLQDSLGGHSKVGRAANPQCLEGIESMHSRPSVSDLRGVLCPESSFQHAVP